MPQAEARAEAAPSAGSRKIVVHSPATGERLGEVPVRTPDEVRAAIGRAREAQPAWEALGFDARAKIMRRALELLLERQDDYAKRISAETGRTEIETIIIDLFPACDSLAYYAKRAKKMLADESRGLHLLRNKKLVVTYRPLGVVGIITPWNGPFILPLNPSVQALMAGNAVILKPSEVTPLSAELVGELFRDAGVPDGVFTVVQGEGETGAALVEGGVDKISFTGSVGTGRRIAEACGRNLVPCTLELGGKDAMIVCADADIERAAGGAVFGGFINAGQFCCGTERVYVAESVADELIGRVVEQVKALRLGTGGDFDVGPMIWPRQLEIVERHVEDALAKGARALTGGRRATEVGERFYEPTVLVDVTHDMAVMQEETFGPILPIMRVADDDEALRMANDSSYGLSGTIWTRDSSKALRLAKSMVTGSVCVNDTSITYGVHEAPFGGRKHSGVGTANGEIGLKSFCHAQPVIFDRFGQKAESVWFPYSGDKTEQMKKAMRWIWGTPLRHLLS